MRAKFEVCKNEREGNRPGARKRLNNNSQAEGLFRFNAFENFAEHVALVQRVAKIVHHAFSADGAEKLHDFGFLREKAIIIASDLCISFMIRRMLLRHEVHL